MASLDQLFAWMRKHAAILDGFAINSESPNRYGYAVRSLRKGEKIISVPIELCVRANAALEYLYHRFPKLQEHTFSNRTLLALYLVLEKENNDNFYKPYFDILPTDFSTFPDKYSAQERSLLEGSRLCNFVELLTSQREEAFAAMMSLEPTLSSLVTFDQLTDAELIIRSRGFARVASDGNDLEGLMMVPGDLLNHSSSPNIKNYLSDCGRYYYFEANRDIEQGESLEIRYGKKDSTYLLLHYGFLLEGIPFHSTFINSTLGQAEAWPQKQLPVALDNEQKVLTSFDTLRYFRFNNPSNPEEIATLELAQECDLHEYLVALCNEALTTRYVALSDEYQQALAALSESCEEKAAIIGNLTNIYQAKLRERKSIEVLQSIANYSHFVLSMPAEESLQLLQRDDSPLRIIPSYRDELIKLITLSQQAAIVASNDAQKAHSL